jgi:hypothetical protein
MTSTVLTEALIMSCIDMLRHGGSEAVELFLEMSKRLHQRGEKGALQDWVTVAAPALPEKERNEVLVMLMCSHLFLDGQMQAKTGSRTAAPCFIDWRSAAAGKPVKPELPWPTPAPR